MPKYEIFAKNLKAIRLNLHMTQEKFAAYIGTNRSAYGSYEEGRAVPRLAAMAKIAAKLGIDEMSLFISTEVTAEKKRKKKLSALEIKYSKLTPEKKQVVDMILNQ